MYDEGNVYILSAHAFSENNWILIYDDAGTSEHRVLITEDPNQNIGHDYDTVLGPMGPNAMALSPRMNRLYLAPTAVVSDPNGPAASQLYSYIIDRSGSAATGLSLNNVTNIEYPDLVLVDQFGLGFAAGVTAIQEQLSGLWVVGFASPRFPADFASGDPGYDSYFCSMCPVFTAPTLAGVQSPDLGQAQGVQIHCHDLALPISAVALGASDLLGDMDGDGDVDLADYGLFAAAMNGPGEPLTEPAADLDGDQDSDLDDFAVFAARYTAAP